MISRINRIASFSVHSFTGLADSSTAMVILPTGVGRSIPGNLAVEKISPQHPPPHLSAGSARDGAFAGPDQKNGRAFRQAREQAQRFALGRADLFGDPH